MQPGDLVGGRYRIVRRAGAGGMATVYQALDLREQRTVALKLVHDAEPRLVERFEREIRILSSLRHPGIVRYLAHGASDAGAAFLVMEWLEGEDLKQRLARGPLSVDETLRLARRIADALGLAHTHGIVHRDVKPGNIFLADGEIDRVKLIDFGVAKLLPADDGHTGPGGRVGTAGYMAPEQVVAHADIDARADVFSLGCVLFACLTGHPPFVARQRDALLVKTLLDEPPRISELDPAVPDALSALVEQMLAKDRSERPRDGAWLGTQLAALRRDEPTATAPHQRVALSERERRHLCVILVGAASDTSRDASSSVSTGTTRDTTEIPRERLAAHGARIEVLADGSLVAVLGGATVATDRAANAARCALALRAVRPSAPVAMATGWGTVTGVLPVGDVIDRAAELLRREASDVASGAPRIRIDELSAAFLDRRFVVRNDAGGLFLEGERPATERGGAGIGWRTPFVGRERELATLTGLLDRCLTEPSPSAALVTGAPGSGKSRLCEELFERIATSGRPVQVWSARGEQLTAGSPLRLLGVALRGTAGILDDDAPAVQRRKLKARVARNVASDDRARVTWFLGELAGISFPDDEIVEGLAARRDAMLMSDQMRAAWLDFLAAETAAQPVLLALEDLQWGDAATLQFVEAALRRIHDRAWMVLAVARPEVELVFPRLWADRGLQHLQLGELSPRSAERLIRETLGARIAPEAAARLIEQAGGNVFFLEELIRAVARERGGRMPATLLAMVEARLEALPPGARRVLRAGSVFGRQFPRGGLGALVGERVDGIPVAEWLGELVDAELVVAGDQDHGFRHDLVREAAYASLTDDDRRLGHRLALAWLEHAGERDPLLLAEHAERGGDSTRAVIWLELAAEQALEANDLVAATARASHAVSLGPPPVARGMLYVVLAEANRWRGQNLRAARYGLAALRHLEPGGVDWYRAAGTAALACGRLGQVHRLRWLAEWLARAWEASSRDVAVVASALLVGELLHAGEYATADEILSRIAPIATELARRDPLMAARVHEAQTIQSLLRGELEAALRHCETAVAEFDRAGDVRSACLRRVSVAYLLVELGAYERAEEVLRATAATALDLGLENVAAVAWQNLGLVLCRLGRHAEGRELEEHAVAALAAQGHRRMEGLSRQYLAIILDGAGEHERAEAEARRSVELLQIAPPGHAYALATHARILLALGRLAEARAAAGAAAEILASLEWIEEGEASIRLVHAETLRATGARDNARAALAAAVERVRARAARFHDPSLRASFLARVPENARTLDLHASWEAES